MMNNVVLQNMPAAKAESPAVSSGLNTAGIQVLPSGREPLAVSVAEAARLLGVSKPTVYTLIRRSDFPSFKVGGRSLISVEGLKAWVAAQAGGCA